MMEEAAVETAAASGWFASDSWSASSALSSSTSSTSYSERSFSFDSSTSTEADDLDHAWKVHFLFIQLPRITAPYCTSDTRSHVTPSLPSLAQYRIKGVWSSQTWSRFDSVLMEAGYQLYTTPTATVKKLSWKREEKSLMTTHR